VAAISLSFGKSFAMDARIVLTMVDDD